MTRINKIVVAAREPAAALSMLVVLGYAPPQNTPLRFGKESHLTSVIYDCGEDPAAHTLLAKIYLMDKGDYARAEAEARNATAIDPNNSEALATLAEILLYTERAEAATQILQKNDEARPRIS